MILRSSNTHILVSKSKPKSLKFKINSDKFSIEVSKGQIHRELGCVLEKF